MTSRISELAKRNAPSLPTEKVRVGASAAIAWLDDEIGALHSGERVLVLCRTRESLSLVYRWALHRNGVLGIEAATIPILAKRVLQDPLLYVGRDLVDPGRQARDLVSPPTPWGAGDVALPLDTEMGRRIGARPGLTSVASRWVRRLRAARRVGLPIAAPRWLLELEAVGFGVDEEERAVLALFSAAEDRGNRISPSSSWDRVVCIGFERPHHAMSPWEPALVRALTGILPSPPAETASGPIRAIAVSDVTAEARVATLLASEDPEGTLVLVTEQATARRLRDTLARNGLSCAWRDSVPLLIHDLARVALRTASWFGCAPDPAIHVADLAEVFGKPALTEVLHPAAREACARLLGDEAQADVYRDQALLSVIGQTRLLESTLSGWRARLRPMLAEFERRDPRKQATAELIVRIELLRACLEGRPFDEVLAELFGASRPFDADDFDNAVAVVLGHTPLVEALPEPATLGAVHRFLSACRPRSDDPGAVSILALLRARASERASTENLHHILANAQDPGILSDGVDVITVDDWDGRPCRHLVLLDVHDHGLVKRSTPDPLLRDEEIEGMYALPGAAATRERLLQIHRAIARCERVTAIVTERDASGRRVVPPIQLDLCYEESTIPRYGLHLEDLPESRSVILERVEEGVPIRPEHLDPAVKHLATQAIAEWYRAGRGPTSQTNTTPPWVLPYLGHSDFVFEASLPSDRSHSIQELFKPLARCAYRAFAEVILGIGEVTDEQWPIEPRELSHVAERALERIGPRERLRPEDPQAEQKRNALVSTLIEATDRAFSEALSDRQPLSPARRASAEGRRQRWNAHWPSYVASRTVSPPSPSVEQMMEFHPLVQPAITAFRDKVLSGGAIGERIVRSWVIWAARCGPDTLEKMPLDMLLRKGEHGELPQTVAAELPLLGNEPAMWHLHQAITDASRRMEAWKRTPDLSVLEAPFGSTYPAGGVLDLGNAALRLGSQDLAVSGRIDRVDLITTASGERLASVVDYGTGAWTDGWQFRRDQFSLRDPELLLYAMVIERAGRGNDLPEAFRKVRAAIIAQDNPDQGVLDPEQATMHHRAPETWIPIDRTLLGWAAKRLGSLVDDARIGRWPLLPRADACPMLAGYGRLAHSERLKCPAACACRLRGDRSASIATAP